MTPFLLIALEFGPVQTTGAFRSINMARYLPEYGFEPHVLTIEPEHACAIFGANRNDKMLAGLPGSVGIHQMVPNSTVRREGRSQQLIRLLTTLDDRFYWRFRNALSEKLDDLRSNGIEAVCVSVPPFGAARLGELAAGRFGVPLVLDMRDAWSEWSMAPYMSYFHYRARLRDEMRAFNAASAVVTVTERLADIFRGTHSHLPASLFHVVPNGFDGPLLENEAIASNVKSDNFEIAYVGSYYYTPPKPMSLSRPHSLIQYTRKHEDWSYRSPLYFFRAWRALQRTHPDIARRLRYHHIGNAPDWLLPMAAEHGFEKRCKLWGVLPKQELATALDGMNALLATSMKRPNGGDYCLASKTFDYLMARKPVLAMVTEGSQRDFLAESGIAVICDADDEAGSAAAIARLVMGEVPLRLNADYVNQFHQRQAARRMADVLRSSIGGA